MTRQQAVEILEFFRDIDGEIEFKAELYEGERAKAEQQFLRELKTSVQACLDALPYTEKALIWKHYVKKQEWNEIRLGHWYSVRQMNNIVRKGLEELGKRLEREAPARQFLERRVERHTS